MSEQTLLFCVGAAKSGTSWLQTYLRGHDECYFRNLKELHYFDTLEGFADRNHVKRVSKRLAEARERLENHPEKATNKWLPTLISDLEQWLGWFDGQTANDPAYLDYMGYQREPAKIIGDFTPAYGQVSDATLKHMAGLCEKVKFVFLMRDPVERLWSHFRMTAKRQGDDALEASVMKYMNDDNPDLTSMSDYQSTLKRLFRVIPRENVHIEYYERLFTQDALDRLCGFLEIEPQVGKFDDFVHKGRRITLPPILRTGFEQKLLPQYGFVDDFMGGLPPEWNIGMME